MNATQKTTRTYYWEHATDASKFLRSSSAKAMAEVAHAAGGEIGVIVAEDDARLVVRSVPVGASIKKTARRLANA